MYLHRYVSLSPGKPSQPTERWCFRWFFRSKSSSASSVSTLFKLPSSVVPTESSLVRMSSFTLQATYANRTPLTVLGILIGVKLASIPAVGNGYAGVIMSVPPLIGSILVHVLPSKNKVALLFMYWLACGSLLKFPCLSVLTSLSSYFQLPLHTFLGMDHVSFCGAHQE